MIWPTNKFFNVLERRYGPDGVMIFRNLEKIQKKINKLQLDIDYLEKCLGFNVIPKFLFFKLANHRLRNSKVYHEIQLKLLQEEIKHHKKLLHEMLPKRDSLLSNIHSLVTWYDFLVINSQLKEICKKEYVKVNKRQEKKLKNLCKEKSFYTNFDIHKLIYNFSDRNLNDAQKSALMKGLRYGIPPVKINEFDIYTSFEMCYSGLKGLQIAESNITNERFKHKFAEHAYNYYQKYDHKKEKNFTDDEMHGLKELQRDKDIVILKADKGNCTVILRKTDYITELENMLQDRSKFKLLAEDPTIKRENKLIRHLLELKRKGAISEWFYDRVRPGGSQPARLYGLPKVHKSNHPLRPICSSVNSYNYKLAAELASILSPYTTNQYSVKNTFSFFKEIRELNFNASHICSFDVSSLFTSIPLEETIDIALTYLFEHNTTVNGLSKKQFKKLLEIATRETHFLFNEKVYDQIDGVSMGSPLAPVLANLFMKHLEEIALENFKGNLLSFFRRYVDDSFVIFERQTDIQPFFEYINTLHRNIVFTKEEQSNETDYFPFLDVKIMKINNSFRTSTYQKPTNTGLYTNWYSFTLRKYKINLVKCLLFRAWNICSDRNLFDNDCKTIKDNLLKNQYPEKLLDAIIKNFITEQTSLQEKPPTPLTVPKKEILMVLPYLGHDSSFKLKKSLVSLFSKAYPQVDLKIVFRTTLRIANLFRYKDIIPKRLKSFIVYGVYCTDCDACYVGKTKRHLITRFKEHTDVRKPTAVMDHVMNNNHNVIFDDVKILCQGISDKELLIKESLTVKKMKPIMNMNITSFPLEIF